MPLTDEELWDFDHGRLADFDLSQAKAKLAGHGDIYRVQLVAARFVDGWRDRMNEMKESPSNRHDDTWYDGFNYAMREVAAHLRQGDLIPGGILYEETDEGTL